MLKEKTAKRFLTIVLTAIIKLVSELTIKEKPSGFRNKVWATLKKQKRAVIKEPIILVKKKTKFCTGEEKKKKIANNRLESFNKKRIGNEGREIKFEDLSKFNENKLIEFRSKTLKLKFSLFLSKMKLLDLIFEVFSIP